MPDDVQPTNGDYYRYITDEAPEFLAVMQIKGKDYLSVPQRHKWALYDWHEILIEQATQLMGTRGSRDAVPGLIADQLKHMGFHIHTKMETHEVFFGERKHKSDDGDEIVEHFERPTSYAIFSCFIRDPYGNEATGWAKVSKAEFSAYFEKAETKAFGRALFKLGFGTDFMPDMDDDEEASIKQNPANMADSPVDLAAARERRATAAPAAPVVATPAAAAPAPVAQPTPVAPAQPDTNPRTMAGMTPRSKLEMKRIGAEYPGFLAWAQAKRFPTMDQSQPFIKVANEAEAQLLKLNAEGWLGVWLAVLDAEGSSLAKKREEQDTKLRAKGTTYLDWAAEQGVVFEDPTPSPAPVSDPFTLDEEETPAPAPEVSPIDEMLPLNDGSALVRPGDPESPTENHMKLARAEIEKRGKLTNEGVVKALGTWAPYHRERVREQYLTPLMQTKLANNQLMPAMCWTQQQVFDLITALRKLPEQPALAA